MKKRGRPTRLEARLAVDLPAGKRKRKWQLFEMWEVLEEVANLNHGQLVLYCKIRRVTRDQISKFRQQMRIARKNGWRPPF